MASGIPACEMVFSLNSNGNLLLPVSPILFGPSDFPHQHEHGIIEFVDYAFLQRNDRVVGDVNLFGTDFCAAFRNVAQTDTEFILEHSGARLGVEGMHLEPRHSHEEPRSPEVLQLLMLAKNVAHILA